MKVPNPLSENSRYHISSFMHVTHPRVERLFNPASFTIDEESVLKLSKRSLCLSVMVVIDSLELI